MLIHVSAVQDSHHQAVYFKDVKEENGIAVAIQIKVLGRKSVPVSDVQPSHVDRPGTESGPAR